MLSLTLFILAFGGLIISKRLWDDYFTPPAIYNFFWALSLGLLELDWVSYDQLLPKTWMVIIKSYLAFMAGAMTIGLYAWSRKEALCRPPAFHITGRLRLERILLIVFLIGVLGFALQLFHLQQSIGLLTYLTDPQTARAGHSNIKYLGFFNILNLANFTMASLYLILYRKPRKWVILMLFWAVLTTFLSTDRTRFFYMVIWTFYAVVYARRKVDLTPRVVVSGLATLLVLVGFFMLIAKIYVKQAYDDNMEFINLPPKYALVVDPYIYMTGSYPVLQAFLEDPMDPTYGKHSFEPFVKVIEALVPTFHRAQLVTKFYRVPIELNVCTYLQPFYLDFGKTGLILGPFATGLLVMGIYVAMRQRKTFFSVYLAGLVSFCTTISIFVNHFTQTATWFFVLVGYVVYRATLTPGRPEAQDEFHSGMYPPEQNSSSIDVQTNP